MKVKGLSKANLIALNEDAIKANRNRTLWPDKLEALPDDKLYPISMSFIHREGEIRCRVIFDEQGTAAYLDMPTHVFNRIPEVDLPDRG